MLAELATVKLRLGIELFDTSQDQVITSLLKHVSARFAAECNRVFDYASGVACEFRADQISINVDRPPIESVSAFSLKDSEQDGWIEQSNVKYLLLPQRAVIELTAPLGARAQLARVTYTGGYVLPGTAPTGNQVALPDDLENACIEQLAYWYQRRSQLGLTTISTEGGIVQQFQTSDLLPQVRAVLNHYERWVN